MFSTHTPGDSTVGTLGSHFEKHCYRMRRVASSPSIVMTITITCGALPDLQHYNHWSDIRHLYFLKLLRWHLHVVSYRTNGLQTEKTTIFAEINLKTGMRWDLWNWRKKNALWEKLTCKAQRLSQGTGSTWVETNKGSLRRYRQWAHCSLPPNMACLRHLCLQHSSFIDEYVFP